MRKSSSSSVAKARSLANGLVKAKTGDDVDETVYKNWYSAVYQPTEEEPEPDLDPEEDENDPEESGL